MIIGLFLIKDAQGKGEELLRETERLIKESNIPDVEMERINLSISGGLSGIFSKTKDKIPQPWTENQEDS